MDFFTILTVGAILLLIILFTTMIVVIYNSTSTAIFPQIPNTCPDYWTFNGSTCNASSMNTKPSLSPYTPDKDICKNNDWAQKNNILWDGVSNYNNCPSK
jgi:hypothetical protein